jgi:tetratricopeptide (TPR) repeat protein
MKLSLHNKFSLPLLLALGGTVFYSVDANAQEEREERRVLKASEVSREQVSSEYRKMARQKRHQEMEFAEDLLRRGHLEGDRSAEMMLRLADLYFQEGRDIFMGEMEKYEAEFDACFNNPNCSTEDMKADNRRSHKWQAKSVRLYKRILQQFPNFRRADEATFYLATALQDTGDRPKGIEYFKTLVRSYPDSGYVPDAFVQIGEYYFDENNAYRALQAYRKAAKFRDSEKFGFALYKLSWCYYNVAEYGKAIDTMKRVVALESAGEGSRKKKTAILLSEEALKDLVRFFADAGDMDGAIQYFTQLGKTDLIRSMLKRLAGTYLEQGKFEQTIQTYRRLIARNPNAADTPDYQDEIIKAYLKMGKKQEAVEEIEKLRRTYGPGSNWARQNAADGDATKAAQTSIERNLRTVAQNFHEEARKLRAGRSATEAYTLAKHAYTVYIQDFPDSKYAYDMRYQYGELLYKIKEFDTAYKEYMKVVAIDTNGKHSKFCAESAIHAADAMIKRDGKTKVTKGSIESVDLNEWEANLLSALDQFATLFPEDKKTKDSIYRSAYLLYEHNQFKEASTRFRTVIRMDPRSGNAEKAAHLILDTLGLIEDWTTLREVAKDFLSQENLGSKKFKGEMAEVYENSTFKLVQVNHEAKEDWKGAAEGFSAFYAEFPESKNADKALNNAAVYFQKVGNRAEAIATRRIIVEKFSKSEFFKDQLALLAYDIEMQAGFEESAALYEQLYKLDTKHDKAAIAIYTAAKFREAMGEWEQAIANYRSYIKSYPDKTEPSAKLLSLDIARIYESNGKWNQASKAFYDFFTQRDTSGISPDQLLYARLQYGKALVEMNQERKTLSHYQKSLDWVSSQKAKGAEFVVGKNFVAEMMFALSEDAFQAYNALALTGPTGKVSRKREDQILGDQLQEKKKALANMEQVFANVVKTGAGEWSIAALVRLAQLYDDMADTFFNSHTPDYLQNPRQRRFYESGMKNFANTYMEKALGEYNKALTKAYEINLYNEYTELAATRRSEILPLDFPVMVEQLIDPGFTSSAKTTTSFVTDFEGRD